MEYYRINYKKLENLKQINYLRFIIIVIIIFIILILLGFTNYMVVQEKFYGIYSDDVLKIKINTKLSDKFKNNNKVTFNNQEISYEIVGFEDYEIINNEIYTTLDLKTDGNFYQNEVGEVIIYFDKQKLITYFWKLFK